MLKGNKSTISSIFESLGNLKPTVFEIVSFMISSRFPILARLPSYRNQLTSDFKTASDSIGKVLVERARNELGRGAKGDHSVIGLLSRNFGLNVA